MKTIKIWSLLPKELKTILLDIVDTKELNSIEEYNELLDDEIDNLYIEIGGEG
jgi:hypothetical protein